MPLKGNGFTAVFTVWSTATDEPATGEAANLTIYLGKDGTAAAATSSPAEIDATNLPGEYKIVLTDAEMDYETVVLGGVCSTSDIVVIPLHIITDAYPIASEINTEVDSAIETYRLDELMTAALSAQPFATSLLADLTEDDGGTQRFNANALEEAPVTGVGVGDATEAKQDTMTSAIAALLVLLDEIQGTGFVEDTNSLVNLLTSSGYAGGGSGAISYVYTLTEPTTGVPIADASVYVSADSDGSDPVALQITDADGQCTFHLDAGTYYFFAYHPTHAPINPDIEKVS